MSELSAAGPPSTSSRCGPARAALGLASAGARELVRIPLSLLRLPLATVQHALVFGDAVRQGYEDLALKGLRQIGFLRNGGGGGSAEFGPGAHRGYAASEDAEGGYAAEEAGADPDGAFAHFDAEFDALVSEADPEADLASLARELGTDIGADLAADGAAGAPPAQALGQYAQPDGAAGGATDDLRQAAAAFVGTSSMDSADAGAAGADLTLTPPVNPADERADSGQQPEAVDIVTRAAVAAEQAAAEDLPEVDRADLPIENFDSVTAGSLRGRLRRLDLGQLRTLRLYEQEHGRRLPILTLLENRIAKLEAAAPA